MKKSANLILSAVLITGCASVSQQVVTLENGQKREIVHSRGGVDFFDCGTQQLGFLFDMNGNLLANHSERGEAFHCGFFNSTVDGLAGQAAAAVILTKGAAKAAKAGANAANSVNITNSNANDAEGYYTGEQSFTQTGGSGLGGVGGNGLGGIGGSGTTTHGSKGNNGFGNGAHDGSPNGKDDSTR